VTFAWIEERRDQWPVAQMCRALGVSRAGYYAWRTRQPSAAEVRREELTEEIATIHAQVKGRYGSPRIHAELVGRGHGCCVNFVAKVMRAAGIAAKTKRKFKQTTDSNHALPVAENLLDREFDPEEPNVRWCADITYVPTREGWQYLAVVEDLFSRMVVGWSMDQTMTSRLVVDALEMALARRPSLKGSSPSRLLAHSDRGSQYASEHYQRRLLEERIACSMSRRGDCWDNAPMESFFASLKKELVHHEDYATREQAKASIFEYIEAFYNRARRHSSLGYVSPAEYERMHNQNHR
jgi:transposase InsO family protein